MAIRVTWDRWGLQNPPDGIEGLRWSFSWYRDQAPLAIAVFFDARVAAWTAMCEARGLVPCANVEPEPRWRREEDARLQRFTLVNELARKRDAKLADFPGLFAEAETQIPGQSAKSRGEVRLVLWTKGRRPLGRRYGEGDPAALQLVRLAQEEPAVYPEAPWYPTADDSPKEYDRKIYTQLTHQTRSYQFRRLFASRAGVEVPTTSLFRRKLTTIPDKQLLELIEQAGRLVTAVRNSANGLEGLSAMSRRDQGSIVLQYWYLLPPELDYILRTARKPDLAGRQLLLLRLGCRPEWKKEWRKALTTLRQRIRQSR